MSEAKFEIRILFDQANDGATNQKGGSSSYQPRRKAELWHRADAVTLFQES